MRTMRNKNELPKAASCYDLQHAQLLRSSLLKRTNRMLGFVKPGLF